MLSSRLKLWWLTSRPFSKPFFTRLSWDGRLHLGPWSLSQRYAPELRPLSLLLSMDLYMTGVVHQRQEAEAAIHLRTTFTGWCHDTAVGPLLRCVSQLDGLLCPAAVDIGDVVHRQATVQAALTDRAAVLLFNPQGFDDGGVALNAASEITPVLRITQQLASVFWAHLR